MRKKHNTYGSFFKWLVRTYANTIILDSESASLLACTPVAMILVTRCIGEKAFNDQMQNCDSG